MHLFLGLATRTKNHRKIWKTRSFGDSGTFNTGIEREPSRTIKFDRYGGRLLRMNGIALALDSSESVWATMLCDLDELILKCRDKNAKLYISEAVASYRSGAYRSSIVSCWTAVCFDIIDKIRELALACDKEAEQQVQQMEDIQSKNDMVRALKFEREILDVATTKFELLSPVELIDLKRLQEDRNRCAHPSLVSDSQAYNPPAELARLHLYNAVTHVLQHPPVQGKSALDRLISEVESDYFPRSAEDAVVIFRSGPILKPRDSLLRNFLMVGVKCLLQEQIDHRRRMNWRSTIKALKLMHPSRVELILSADLSKNMRSVNDGSLSLCVEFISYFPESWRFLEPDLHLRIQNYVEKLPSTDYLLLDFLLKFSPLKQQAKSRVERSTLHEIRSCNHILDMPSEVVHELISIYSLSDSFIDANSCAKVILEKFYAFNQEDVVLLISTVKVNSQVTNSHGFGLIIENIRKYNRIERSELNKVLSENGLARFIRPD